MVTEQNRLVDFNSAELEKFHSYGAGVKRKSHSYQIRFTRKKKGFPTVQLFQATLSSHTPMKAMNHSKLNTDTDLRATKDVTQGWKGSN